MKQAKRRHTGHSSPDSAAPGFRDVRLLFIVLFSIATTSNSLFLRIVLSVSVCVGLSVSVYGATLELGVQPLNVLSACHTEWVDVVRPPMCAFHRCHPNSCPPTLLLSLSFFHTNPPIPIPPITPAILLFYNSTQL